VVGFKVTIPVSICRGPVVPFLGEGSGVDVGSSAWVIVTKQKSKINTNGMNKNL
jgi:hypothetical protein